MKSSLSNSSSGTPGGSEVRLDGAPRMHLRGPTETSISTERVRSAMLVRMSSSKRALFAAIGSSRELGNSRGPASPPRPASGPRWSARLVRARDSRRPPVARRALGHSVHRCERLRERDKKRATSASTKLTPRADKARSRRAGQRHDRHQRPGGRGDGIFDAGEEEADGGSDASVERGPTGAPVASMRSSRRLRLAECKPVLAGSTGSVCVTPCNAPTNCAELLLRPDDSGRNIGLLCCSQPGTLQDVQHQRRVRSTL